MEDITELKQEYNRLLKRHIAAEEFFNDSSISLEEKIYNQPEYSNVVNELNDILERLKAKGIKVNDNEILGGMKV